MGARLVEPEHGRRAGRPRARDREPDPVLDRRVLGLAHAPDVARLHLVLEQRLAGVVDNPDPAVGRDLERLVVGAVLLRLLGHQTDVRRAPHRSRIKCAVLATVLERLGVERRVGVVGDHELRVLQLAGAVVHLARGTDRGRHRGVDDHVTGNVQVGDPAIGVDHREAWAGCVRGVDRRLHRRAVVVVERLDRAQQGADAVVGIDARRLQFGGVVGEQPRKERAYRVAEDDRVRDLHHRRLQVDREQDPAPLGIGDLLGQEPLQHRAAHHRRVEHLAVQHREVVLEHGDRSVGRDVLDPHRAVSSRGDRALGASGSRPRSSSRRASPTAMTRRPSNGDGAARMT